VFALQSIPCDCREGGIEPAKYPGYSNYHSSTHNEHNVYFHLRGRENGSVKIRYFSGPAVNCDVSQPEGFEFGYIKGRLAGASFKELDHPLQATDAIFQPIEAPTLERVFQE
jgi:hypothetical protein